MIGFGTINMKHDWLSITEHVIAHYIKLYISCYVPCFTCTRTNTSRLASAQLQCAVSLMELMDNRIRTAFAGSQLYCKALVSGPSDKLVKVYITALKCNIQQRLIGIV